MCGQIHLDKDVLGGPLFYYIVRLFVMLEIILKIWSASIAKSDSIINYKGNDPYSSQHFFFKKSSVRLLRQEAGTVFHKDSPDCIVSLMFESFENNVSLSFAT